MLTIATLQLVLLLQAEASNAIALLEEFEVLEAEIAELYEWPTPKFRPLEGDVVKPSGRYL